MVNECRGRMTFHLPTIDLYHDWNLSIYDLWFFYEIYEFFTSQHFLPWNINYIFTDQKAIGHKQTNNSKEIEFSIVEIEIICRIYSSPKSCRIIVMSYLANMKLRRSNDRWIRGQCCQICVFLSPFRGQGCQGFALARTASTSLNIAMP